MLIGQCPLHMVEPPCPLPDLARAERKFQLLQWGFPPKYVEEASWGQCVIADEVREWVRVRPRPGLLLLGDLGVGKTMAAVLAARDLEGRAVFSYWGDLTSGDRHLIHRAELAPVLVVDDFGIGDPAPWNVGVLETLFERRHGRRQPTIVTANLRPDELKRDEQWRRVVDRWRESMRLVTFPDGKSRRGA